ncbi:MAG: 2-hydroxyacyl-CoA dehydratase [Clostridia bacterium]|nr:2-hydroxyacyl-CoA dehydratase [Clostridia bacterium]
MSLNVGIDIGSTTVKVVVTDDGEIIFKHYERHYSQVRSKALEILKRAQNAIGDRLFAVAISGSAGFGVAKSANIEFVQEVFATSKAIKSYADDIDIVIELGGEDAKILFFTGGLEERMNGSCAGGTGAFIDQMATLLNLSLDEMDELSLQSTKLYPIASRCGVFAKSDIQPLLNQGADKADISASIFQAVVDQTITGLAQGRRLEGKIAFLGGPLHFFHGLRKRFVETLNLTEENAIFSELGQFAVAIGAALYAEENSKLFSYDDLIKRIEDTTNEVTNSRYLKPLFNSSDEYEEFCQRHKKASVKTVPIDEYCGNAYLGIDCGSTTVKLVLIGENSELLYHFYDSNRGSTLDIVKEQLINLYHICNDRIKICSGVVTGYGEELIKNAFRIDMGIVETMAHFTATRHFCPDVDFILDIGGQDIKCFKVKNDSIDSIMLNEACSSGCGSFIETFAKSMGYSVAEFAQRGIFAKNPVDLGSRCTVFMNSSVKQAQKEGAGVEDISAGLSMSVVKNAIYKVIRAHSADELGEKIVVQGGTFYNDAVLRSFEQELGKEVIRPTIAGLMGAYGAALYAKAHSKGESSIMSLSELEAFTHSAKAANCGICTNKCSLTVITFSDGKKHISGNRCERPLGKGKAEEVPNIYEYKRKRLENLVSVSGKRGKIGIPLGLNMYENAPFWHAFLTDLGYEVVFSGFASKDTYKKGRYSVASDTVCYPAKLVHGHIETLLEQGIDTIFYPCLTYNFDEGKGDNHYNCPVVAYYPELLRANIEKLSKVNFWYPYFGLHRPKDFVKKAYEFFKEKDSSITLSEIKRAANVAYSAYDKWKAELLSEGAKALEYAKKNDKQVFVLAGRPYHIDPEINHGIDRMISSFGIVIVSEDCVADLVAPQKVNVLNQWTYHSRLYNAAKYCTQNENCELVQLVSFGCGLDAVTTDEVRDILEKGDKLYTQLKIDDIDNLGAVKIRIRSLLGAIDERKNNKKERDV